MNFFKIFFSLSFGLLCLNAWGKDPIQSEVTVTKSYEPQLDQNIQKIPFPAMIPDSMKVKPKIPFSSKHIMVTPGKFNPGAFEAMSLVQSTGENTQNPLWDASVGFGTLIDPYLRFQGTGNDPRYGIWQAEFLHSSVHSDITRFNGLNTPNHCSLTQLSGSSEWTIWNKYLLRANAGFENRYNTIYGYSDTSLSVVPYQSTMLFYGNAAFEKIMSNDTEWFYRADLNTQYWSGAYDNGEFVWNLKGSLEKRRSADERMGVSLRLDQLIRQNFFGESTNTVLQLMPYYTKRMDRMLVNGSLKLVYDNSTVKHLTPYLNARVSYDLNGDQIACPFVAIEGDHQINSLSDLARTNPYLAPNISTPENTAYRFGVRYGVEGKMGNIFTYHISQAFKSVHDALFFINYPSEAGGSEGFFSTRLDNIRIQETRIEASYNIIPHLSADGKLYYRGYHLNTLGRPYQLPAVESGITLKYAILNKIRIGLTGHYYGDFYGNQANAQLTEVSVPSSFNLSMQGEYQLYNQYRIWLNLDNLLNRDIYRFYRYNDYGIHIQAGIGVHF